VTTEYQSPKNLIIKTTYCAAICLDLHKPGPDPNLDL